MKNKTSNKRTKKTNKVAAQYSIDLDVKGVFFFVTLALATAVVVFYLGVLFGKASRDPNFKPFIANESAVPAKTSEEKITTNDLEIYNIRNDDDKISTLKKDTQSVLEEADRVINQSKNYQGEDTKQVEIQKPSTKSIAPETPKPKQWPEQTTPSKLAKDTYTVQVFATKDKNKAGRIIKLLRRQQFDAYLARVSIENQTIYRVRIGRKSKTEIEKLNKDLKKVIGGMGMKSRIIKLN